MDLVKLRREMQGIIDRDGLSLVKVASACDLDDPRTVDKFLKGESTPHRTTILAFRDFVAARKQPHAATKAATG